MGVFRIAMETLKGLDLEELELDLMDHGLEEMGEGTDDNDVAVMVIRTNLQDFGKMQSALEEKKLEVLSTASEFIPQTTVELDDEKATEALKVVDLLEQDDDIQQVFHNLA